MADAITAEDAAQLLTLVAPGYFATVGYGWVLPQRAREELPTLLASVALSLPLVTAGKWIASQVGMDADPAEAGYVALLVGLSLLAGYLGGHLRSSRQTRWLLLRVGHRSDPELSVLVRTVQRMKSKAAQVTVNFKDGRRLAGTPRFATEDPEASDRELYLDYTRWWDKDNKRWTQRRSAGGVLVRMDEVQSIELGEDPE